MLVSFLLSLVDSNIHPIDNSVNRFEDEFWKLIFLPVSAVKKNPRRGCRAGIFIQVRDTRGF
jgi:hypothetical protein